MLTRILFWTVVAGAVALTIFALPVASESTDATATFNSVCQQISRDADSPAPTNDVQRGQ